MQKEHSCSKASTVRPETPHGEQLFAVVPGFMFSLSCLLPFVPGHS